MLECSYLKCNVEIFQLPQEVPLLPKNPQGNIWIGLLLVRTYLQRFLKCSDNKRLSKRKQIGQTCYKLSMLRVSGNMLVLMFFKTKSLQMTLQSFEQDQILSTRADEKIVHVREPQV